MTIDKRVPGGDVVMILRAAAGHRIIVRDELHGALGPFIRAQLRRIYRAERRSGSPRPSARVYAIGDLVHWSPVIVERV